MPESSRNIRRRLIDEHEEIDTSLPPAVQLARARAAARRRTDESAGKHDKVPTSKGGHLGVLNQI